MVNWGHSTFDNLGGGEYLRVQEISGPRKFASNILI